MTEDIGRDWIRQLCYGQKIVRFLWDNYPLSLSGNVIVGVELENGVIVHFKVQAFGDIAVHLGYEPPNEKEEAWKREKWLEMKLEQKQNEKPSA